MHILDNKCSAKFKEKILENDMTYQLVPPHDHRRNVAEKAVQVFKDHFIAVLCGTDNKFPIKLWCQILRQAEHQLNLLRKSRVDPSKPSFEVMNGKHDYNVNPFAPLGCAVEIHVVPSKKKNMGSPYENRLLPWKFMGTLQMPRNLDRGHTKCPSGTNSVLQAQIPDTAICHTDRRGPSRL